MKTKFLGLVASLVLLGAAQANATTIYAFDMQAIGSVPAAGTVGYSVNGTNATFTVALPSDYTISELAFNLNPGATVNAGSYSVAYNAAVNFNQGTTYPNYGPFNTTVTALNGGNFGNSLTFIVSNFAGIFNVTTNGNPIWFVAIVKEGSNLGAIAADAPVATPLPAALPLFASGLGAVGLLGWRKRRKVKTAA